MEATAPKEAAPKAAAKKGVDINVQHCLDPSCAALMGYEVNSEGVLYVDLAHTATVDGAMRFFPCPKCGGRNVVEAFTDEKGKARHKVVRFVAA